MERRDLDGGVGASGRTLFGEGAVYDTPSRPEFEQLTGIRESIAPGAFDDWLSEGRDVLCCFAHNQAAVLGRLHAGTLRVWSDGRALRYSTELPETQLGRDLPEMIRRRDVTGSSFFFPKPDPGDYTMSRDQDGVVHRRLHRLGLIELGPTPMPVYPQAAANVRELRQLADDWVAEERRRRILGLIRIGRRRRES